MDVLPHSEGGGDQRMADQKALLLLNCCCITENGVCRQAAPAHTDCPATPCVHTLRYMHSKSRPVRALPQQLLQAAQHTQRTHTAREPRVRLGLLSAGSKCQNACSHNTWVPASGSMPLPTAAALTPQKTHNRRPPLLLHRRHADAPRGGRTTAACRSLHARCPTAQHASLRAALMTPARHTHVRCCHPRSLRRCCSCGGARMRCCRAVMGSAAPPAAAGHAATGASAGWRRHRCRCCCSRRLANNAVDGQDAPLHLKAATPLLQHVPPQPVASLVEVLLQPEA